MENVVKPYKLAWLQGGKLHSTMHDTETEARQRQTTVPAPSMVMLMDHNENGHYSWIVLPGVWGYMAKNWLLIAVVLLLLFAFMFWKLNK